MKKLVFLTLLALLYSPAIYAETVSQFVFKTEPQTIEAGANSKTITIQSQNSVGTEESITETFDFVFTSTSGTGEFLSTSGNPVSGTMSKNTANKNFLYKDSTPGTYTISITATGRTSLQTFSVSQDITVVTQGTVIPDSSADTDGGEEEEVTQTPSSSNQIAPSNSAHSSPAPLSQTENKMEFGISAGRSRLTMVGNSVTLIATPTKLQNVSEQALFYEWSLGDGTLLKGKTINHTYHFAGNYPVILNAYASDKQAVSRTEVKVVSPTVSISRVLEGVELWNKSGFEINLEGWKLVSNNKIFTFPKDTIVSSGSKAVFADKITGMSGGEVELLNPLGKLFAKVEAEVIITNNPNFEMIQVSINEVKDKLAKLTLGNETKDSQNETTITEEILTQDIALITERDESEEQVANVAQIFEAETEQGLVSRIFAWPIKGIEYFWGLFSQN